jgi:hypothetical protein
VTGRAALAVALLAGGALLGCSALLPKAQSHVSSPWASFDEARAAIERIVPGETTVRDLRDHGIDPYTSPNVQLLSYSDILLRFPMNGAFAMETLDRGLRECLQAGKACTGYSIVVQELTRDRTGPFWPDALGFKRVTDVSGWTFNALILMIGDRVVYTLYGGQPIVRQQEVSRQPLGPVQDVGQALPVQKLVP